MLISGFRGAPELVRVLNRVGFCILLISFFRGPSTRDSSLWSALGRLRCEGTILGFQESFDRDAVVVENFQYTLSVMVSSVELFLLNFPLIIMQDVVAQYPDVLVSTFLARFSYDCISRRRIYSVD